MDDTQTTLKELERLHGELGTAVERRRTRERTEQLRTWTCEAAETLLYDGASESEWRRASEQLHLLANHLEAVLDWSLLLETNGQRLAGLLTFAGYDEPKVCEIAWRCLRAEWNRLERRPIK